MGVLILMNGAIYNVNMKKMSKWVALWVILTNLIISLLIFILKDPTSEQFEFGSENNYIQSYLNLDLATDNTSLFFVLLVSVIFPIALLSNWKSIKSNVISFLILILLLQILLQLVFFIEDTLLYYVFFESILAPLFILIGLFGSNGRIRASYYIFLYTLIGSLFMLLSIIYILSYIGVTEFLTIYKINFLYLIQVFLFFGIFIAFAVKTPVIYLNNWLLKAHVESPLSGSIILAAIVLKLSLYGIIRLIIPFFPETVIYLTPFIFTIGVLTIIYASLSTIRITDIKELIAYSSVSHAAVYLLGIFSNVIQGIIGAIVLGIGHAFSSSGLFTSVGGVLYDRYHTRLISYFRGIAQIMPIFCILFFLLCLANCGVPLTLNFIGEFTSLYGTFSRLPYAGFLATLSSVILSACYTIYMYNRIAFAGSFYKYINLKVKNFNIRECLPDLAYREFFVLFILLYFTFLLGIFPCFILDNILHDAQYLIFNYSGHVIYADSPYPWENYFKNDTAFPVVGKYSMIFFLAITMYILIKKYKKHFTFIVLKTYFTLNSLAVTLVTLIITTYVRVYYEEEIMIWLVNKNDIFLDKEYIIHFSCWISSIIGIKGTQVGAVNLGFSPMLMGGGENIPSTFSVPQVNEFYKKTDSNPGTPEPNESGSETRTRVRKSNRLKSVPEKEYNINRLSDKAQSNRIEKVRKSKIGSLAKKAYSPEKLKNALINPDINKQAEQNTSSYITTPQNQLGSQQNPQFIEDDAIAPNRPTVTTEQVGQIYPRLNDGNNPYYTLQDNNNNNNNNTLDSANKNVGQNVAPYIMDQEQNIIPDRINQNNQQNHTQNVEQQRGNYPQQNFYQVGLGVNPYQVGQAANPYQVGQAAADPYQAGQDAIPYEPGVNPYQAEQAAIPYEPGVNPFSFQETWDNNRLTQAQARTLDEAKIRMHNLNMNKPIFATRRLYHLMLPYPFDMDPWGCPADYDPNKNDHRNCYTGKFLWASNDWGIFRPINSIRADTSLVVDMTNFDPNGDNTRSYHNMRMGLLNQRNLSKFTLGKIITNDPKYMEFIRAHIQHNLPELHNKLQANEINFRDIRLTDEFIDSLPIDRSRIRPDFKLFDYGWDWDIKEPVYKK